MEKVEIVANDVKIEQNSNLCLRLSFAPVGGVNFKVVNSLNELLSRLSVKNSSCKIGFEQYSKPRSLNANAYFHVLAEKIASKMGLGADEVKARLVLDYGAIGEDSNGKYIGAKLPKEVNVKDYYKYAKYIGEEVDARGKVWYQYLFYKETHRLDSKEMARLIDGAVSEAKNLGIETKTPLEIAQMISLGEKR